MSHFSVAVFTEDNGKTVEELLFPYDENLTIEQYMALPPTNTLTINDSEIFYNPQSKWDWYQTGGRYSGMLKLKSNAKSGNYGQRSWANENEIIPEYMVDSAKLKDIDFSPNQDDYDEAIIFWETYVEYSRPLPEENQRPFLPFKPEDYLKCYGTKENYAKAQSEFSAYAVITPDGVWHSPGDVGWFGMSSETPEEKGEWQSGFYDKFIKNANPELTLTIVDCHI
jgi:hypothetical protein